MLTITTSVHLFTFEELDQSAKDSVAAWYAQDVFDDIFTDTINYEQIPSTFPNSLSVQMHYDFSCCQGAGLNLYGEIGASDLMRLAGIDDDAIAALCKGEPQICIDEGSWRYAFCRWDQPDYMIDVQEHLEALECPECDSQKFASAICDAMAQLCQKYYSIGENILEGFSDPCYYEDYLFLADGTYYCNMWEATNA